MTTSPKATLDSAGPTATDVGKLVISAAKALKPFARADPVLTAELYATADVGRIGLLASALRGHGRISADRFHALASGEGFSPLDCKRRVIPALRQTGLIHVHQTSDSTEIESLVLTFEGLLQVIAGIYENEDPTPSDRAALRLLFEVERVPVSESGAIEILAAEFGEEIAKKAIRLARNYNIVSVKTGFGLKEPLLYSEKVWSGKMNKAGKAMAGLTRTDREALNAIIDKVRTYQGAPEEIIRNEATQNNAEHLLDVAINVGLLSRTDLTMTDGSRRTFLTSPHFYAEVSGFAEDSADRVKIFLDSIRNGQHYGSSGTGRITNPDRLLRKLLNTGEIGPCTAIGTDYITPERAGLIKVRPSRFKRGQFIMELVQRDVVEKVHSIVTTGSIQTSGSTVADDLSDGISFASTEELRAMPGRVAEATAEAERDLIRRLRES